MSNEFELNILYLRKSGYKTKKTMVQKIGYVIDFIIFLLIGAMIANIRKSLILTFGCIILEALNLSLAVFCKNHVDTTLSNHQGKIISNNTSMTYNRFSKLTNPFILIWFLISLTSLYFEFNISDIRFLKLVLLDINMAFCLSLVLLYIWFDMTVIFKDKSFISGKYEVKYDDITKLEVYKRREAFPEDQVYFKIFNHGKMIGYDIMLESNYNFLYNKIYLVNDASKNND